MTVGERSETPFDMIRSIVRDAACPVIAILDVQDHVFIDKAARLGIFSYIAHATDLDEMQSAMDVSLQRFAEYHALEGAFGRRAVTERAKGILMERHAIDEQRSVPSAARAGATHQPKDGRRRASVLESHRLLSSGVEPAEIDQELLIRREHREER